MPTDTRKRFDVLQPIERKDRGTYWMRVGAAFMNRDGSMNIYLDALPIAGKLQVREARDPNDDAHAVADPKEARP